MAAAGALLMGFQGLAPRAVAIEMFTFFGDGSRIGLPSLEVPIEAYPGIPLRSDRIRARRAGSATASRGAPRPPTRAPGWRSPPATTPRRASGGGVVIPNPIPEPVAAPDPFIPPAIPPAGR